VANRDPLSPFLPQALLLDESANIKRMQEVAAIGGVKDLIMLEENRGLWALAATMDIESGNSTS
jgi:hypothetical protein